ncbi:LysM peptidoglycan-binding domain-containing protein [Arthrobacter sp. zg-Y1110]|uniref:LysM peptidoglycan-binding domain-containing protein n=1 Tax=Arthrobacter sp. zg-Y1110 TaxID=2886932 RepID=UPI001D13C3DC|nr:LysM peptidoglycan-binding domain-containing protein [Arthrobacter sp. zg-Y1110]MCC3290466.1 LysM peptidoglycan-binding domain-containing protein [Arthrobacter sp. zg-Y1110]UWX84166.1 LysM peptidoglycan-binding domain-containing protein [Arthrobacter sp. zg-Y1110]
MTGSTSRPGLAADALATAAAAALGLLLLWCGTRMLPDAAVAGSVLFSPGPLSEAPLSRASLTQLAGFCAAAAGLLLTFWWVLGFTCALAGCLLHRFGFRTAGTWTLSLAPGPLRRLATAALGISLAAGGTLGAVPGAGATAAAVPGAPAFARTGIPVGQNAAQATPPEPGSADPAEAISPLWRPSPPQPAAGGLLTGVPRPDEREVVVAAGDTLWSLAASQLGPQATDAETAALWPRWYELNREVIGPDPGLIRPGQVLAVPPP